MVILHDKQSPSHPIRTEQTASVFLVFSSTSEKQNTRRRRSLDRFQLVQLVHVLWLHSERVVAIYRHSTYEVLIYQDTYLVHLDVSYIEKLFSLQILRLVPRKDNNRLIERLSWQVEFEEDRQGACRGLVGYAAPCVFGNLRGAPHQRAFTLGKSCKYTLTPAPLTRSSFFFFCFNGKISPVTYEINEHYRPVCLHGIKF